MPRSFDELRRDRKRARIEAFGEKAHRVVFDAASHA
jgi:hypothetical protein